MAAILCSPLTCALVPLAATAARRPRVAESGPERKTHQLLKIFHRQPKIDADGIFRPPSDAVSQAVQRAVAAILADDERKAARLLATVDLRLDLFREGDGFVWLIHEPKDAPPRGIGFIAVNQKPESRFVVEAPHAQFDRDTPEQAIELFLRLKAQALIIATAHRCSSNLESRCDGLSSVCSHGRKKRPFRISDHAHATETVFHKTHTYLMQRDDSAVAVQLHAFGKRTIPGVDAVISDGTTRRSRRSPAARLTYRLRKLGTGKAILFSCNEKEPMFQLCATANVQGRQANGSSDPCLKRSKKPSGRFIHVEQSPRIRGKNSRVSMDYLARGLMDLPIPATKPPERRLRAEVQPIEGNRQ